MSAAVLELQTAIHSVLINDGALASQLGGPDIFDHTPPSAAFPYITFGRSSVFDWNTSTETGSEVLFSLHVWSRAKGRREALAIMGSVAALLDDVSLPVVGHNLVSLRLQASQTDYDDDVAVQHGLMRFRAVLEPAT